MKEHDRLQELLGSRFAVGGTRKLHVRGPLGKTVGSYDPRASQVTAFAEVKFYGFERTPFAELRALGEQEVRAQLTSLAARGFVADFDAGTVDPLGLSELTNSEDGATFMYVVDLRKDVDGLEDAAATLEAMAEESRRFVVREEDATA